MNNRNTGLLVYFLGIWCALYGLWAFNGYNGIGVTGIVLSGLGGMMIGHYHGYREAKYELNICAEKKP